MTLLLGDAKRGTKLLYTSTAFSLPLPAGMHASLQVKRTLSSNHTSS